MAFLTIPNPGFETAPAFTAATATSSRWIDGTAAGSTTDDTYKFKLAFSGGGAAGSSQFDDSQKHSGTYSLKVSLITRISSTTYTCAASTSQTAIGSAETTTAYLIPIEASTKYVLRFWMKTDSISNDNGKGAKVYWYNFQGTTYKGFGSGDYVNGTTDWTRYEIYFTSSALADGLAFMGRIDGETGSAWFDDITIEKTTLKKFGGVLKADLKTIKGLDIANVKIINGLNIA